MPAQDAHIGPEHGHARAAIYRRAHQIIAAGGLPEPAWNEPDRNEPDRNEPAAEPVAPRPPPESPTPEPRIPAPRAEPPDPEEDLDFLDGRWTSESW